MQTDEGEGLSFFLEPAGEGEGAGAGAGEGVLHLWCCGLWTVVVVLLCGLLQMGLWESESIAYRGRGRRGAEV